MEQMPKQVTGVIVYSVRNAINQYCKRDSRKLTELISGAKCANKAKPEFDHCYANLIDAFQGATNAKDKYKIPHTCWLVHLLLGFEFINLTMLFSVTITDSSTALRTGL